MRSQTVSPDASASVGAPKLSAPASIALYVGTIAATTALGGWALGAGIHPGVVSGVGFFALCAIFLALERWRPWRRAWLRGWSDLRVDLPLIFLAAPAGLFVKWVEGLAAAYGLGLWPNHWPLVAQAALALTVGDFVRYWFHRAEHAWLPLWRIHATHHSAERIYCVNGPRLHPLEVALSGALQTAPLAVLGAGGDALALQVLLTLAIGRFQHCNIALELGPLNYLFSAPDPHRWHHARDARTAQCNYGGDVLLWDHVFGTFFLPKGQEPSDDVGIENGASFPRDLLGVLASPFRWAGFRAPPR